MSDSPADMGADHTQVLRQNLNGGRRTAESSGTKALNGGNFDLRSSDDSSNLNLNHERIGLGPTMGECACAAAHCYKNENIMTFLNARNLREEQRIELVKQVANALEQLHEQDIIHGNIYPGNIAMADDETVFLKNAGVFTGLSKLLMQNPPPGIRLPQSAAYKSPEELRSYVNGMVEPGKPMDVYAFGSTIFEIMTCHRPFFEIDNLCHVYVNIILGGGHTSRLKQATISPYLWHLMKKCWSTDPVGRPTMPEAVGYLKYA